MLESASSATSNGYGGGPLGGPQLGAMSHRRIRDTFDTNQNNHIAVNAKTEVQSTINHHKDVISCENSVATTTTKGSIRSSSSSGVMKKSHSTDRKKVAEAFIMTGQFIKQLIIISSLQQ